MMAEVLSPQPESQTSPFFMGDSTNSASYYTPNLAQRSSLLNAGNSSTKHQPSSLRSHASTTSLSSRTSTSELSNLLSLATPPSSVSSSLEDKYRQELDDDDYPHFEYDSQFIEDEAQQEEDEKDENETISDDTSLPTPTVVDDTAVRQQPSRHVDYLSHGWKEEDIWSSWRHIVSQRKVYGQQSRLENAAWRTWVKNKYQLRTVSPETLNWLKESDVTWLYGPLKPATTHPISQPESDAGSRISKSNSFIVNKKPILKKRSMSEVMLQRSISTSSLVQQAAASIQAQGKRGRRLDRSGGSDFSTSALVSEPPSRDAPGSVISTSSSGTQTPSECREKRHIRFDPTVEQCIAVEAKPEEYDEDEEEDELDDRPGSSLSSNSSDEGLVMMRKPRRPGMYSRQSSTKGSRSNSHQGRKTIETLPSTTLKYRTDSPEVSEEQQQAAMARFGTSRPRLSPSASQETLRPSRPSRNFLLGTEEDSEEDAEETTWSFGSSNPRSSLGSAGNSSDNLKRTALPHSRSSIEAHRSSYDDDNNNSNTSRQLQALESEPGAYGIQGLRRTESGMFMPEDDEDDVIATGLFGKISETVNTARDIAHVIWNVGWRK